METRELILEKLKEMERNIPWLAKKTGINYNTLYHCLVAKNYNISYFNLQAINEALETNFPYNPTRKKTSFNSK